MTSTRQDADDTDVAEAQPPGGDDPIQLWARLNALSRLTPAPLAYGLFAVPGARGRLDWADTHFAYVGLPPLAEAIDRDHKDQPWRATIIELLQDAVDRGEATERTSPCRCWDLHARPIFIQAGGESVTVGGIVTGVPRAPSVAEREAAVSELTVDAEALDAAVAGAPSAAEAEAAMAVITHMASDLSRSLSHDWLMLGPGLPRAQRVRAAGKTSPDVLRAQALQKELQLKEILETMAVGLLVTSTEGRVILANPSARFIFDVAAGELDGRHVLDLIAGSVPFADEWEQLVGGQSDQLQMEVRIQGYRVCDLEISATRMAGTGPLSSGYIVVLKDITRLNELAQLRDQFISNVKHELRTPLTTLRGFAATMLEFPEIDVDRQREFLGYIVQESDRLGRLIEDMLAMARLDIDHSKPRAARIDLRDYLQSLGAYFVEPCAERNLSLHVSIPEALVEVQADGDLLKQLGHNLIGNAIKGTPPGGIIHVGLEVTEDVAVLRVVDNGSGLSAEEQTHIFDRFFRAPMTSGSVPGAGLGLAIVKRIVDAHGWHIGLRSSEGAGTDIWVTMHLAADAPRRAHRPS